MGSSSRDACAGKNCVFVDVYEGPAAGRSGFSGGLASQKTGLTLVKFGASPASIAQRPGRTRNIKGLGDFVVAPAERRSCGPRSSPDPAN